MRTARLLLCIVGAAASLGAAAGDIRPAVVAAAKAGDVAALRALLAGRRADVNAPDGDGATALHWTSHRDDVDSTRLLLAAGANANAANDLGATPLWIASQNGSSRLVQLLLDAGADPNRALLLGETPLMVAARSGSTAVVEQLLAKGAAPNAVAARGQTALMWAAAERHADVVKALVATGADVHLRSAVWTQMMAVPPHGVPLYNKRIPHGGDTALLFAVRSGDLASAAELVAAGADVNDADARGVSATTLAAHSGFRELVTFLLDKGADPNRAAAGFTALHNAIMHRDAAMVGALLSRGADPNARLMTWTPTRRSSRDRHFSPELVGATPYWLAARFGGADVMRLLLTHGANPTVVHEGHYHAEDPVAPRTHVTTPIMAATGMGGGTAWVLPEPRDREAQMLEAVTVAVEHGGDINAQNTDGRTALDSARALKFERVAAFLLDHGSRPRPGSK